MNALALAATSRLMSIAYQVTPSAIRKLGSTISFTYNPMALDINIYYMRYDKHNAGTIVKVFDKQGSLVYTIERDSMISTNWVVYSGIDRTQVAIISLGLRSKQVFYLQNPSLKQQTINGVIDQKLHMNDGTTYMWKRNSRQLSRIINPDDGRGELHQRVAVVNLLRKFRFDWEVIVDEKFDQQVALFSAFVAARTMWPLDTSSGPPVGAV